MAKVVLVTSDYLQFDDRSQLYSDHVSDCCERHWLAFNDLSISDFEGLDFDLSGPDFFEKIEGFGIRLVPTNGHPVSVPGYGSNNGYYSSNLTLVLKKEGFRAEFDISECQEIEDY